MYMCCVRDVRDMGCELGSSVSRETDQTRPDQTEDAMIASWTLALSGSEPERERRGQGAASQPARETKRKINIKNSAVFYGADGGGN